MTIFFKSKNSLLAITCTIKMYNENTSVLYETRYCSQKGFSVALCTYGSVRKLELPFNIKNYEASKQLSVFMKKRYNSKIVACGTDLFVISKSRQNCTFEKYTEFNENKIVLPSTLDKRSNFCVCSFMQKVYVIGGGIITQKDFYSTIASCMCYDI